MTNIEQSRNNNPQYYQTISLGVLKWCFNHNKHRVYANFLCLRLAIIHHSPNRSPAMNVDLLSEKSGLTRNQINEAIKLKFLRIDRKSQVWLRSLSHRMKLLQIKDHRYASIGLNDLRRGIVTWGCELIAYAYQKNRESRMPLPEYGEYYQERGCAQSILVERTGLSIKTIQRNKDHSKWRKGGVVRRLDRSHFIGKKGSPMQIIEDRLVRRFIMWFAETTGKGYKPSIIRHMASKKYSNRTKNSGGVSVL